MSVSGSFLDLKEWACRTARFDATDTSDLALAASAINDAYLSTCSMSEPWDFLEQEGTWTSTASSDVYTYATIASAMSITGAAIDEIIMLTNDLDGTPLESMDWTALEYFSRSTQDGDGNSRPFYWSKWASRIRLYPSPDSTYTFGTYVRLAPAEMSGDTDTPLIPMAWRRRLLVPYAAAILLRTEGGLETAAEAQRLMDQYSRDYIEFRTAHATAKLPTFRLKTPGWEVNNPTNDRGWGVSW